MKIISAGSASVFFRIAGHFSILVGKLLYRYKNPVFYSLFPIKDPLRRQFLLCGLRTESAEIRASQISQPFFLPFA